MIRSDKPVDKVLFDQLYQRTLQQVLNLNTPIVSKLHIPKFRDDLLGSYGVTSIENHQD